MDELKMDALELPDTGESYDDMPDASEGLAEEYAETPRPSDSMDNFSDMDIPVLSEMDGSDITAPAQKEAEKSSPASPDKPVSRPAFEEMGGAAASQPSSTSDSPSVRGTYQSTSSSYRSVSGTTDTGSSSSYQNVSGASSSRSSMDALYEARMAVDPEKYEKGRKKTKVVAGVGVGLYAYNTLSYLLSVIGGGGVSALLDLGVAAITLYLFIRFFIGSNTAKETLATFIGIDVGFNIIGIFTAGVSAVTFSSFGLGGIFGVLAVMGVITLIARCVMLYFLILDDDITEYNKNKK